MKTVQNIDPQPDGSKQHRKKQIQDSQNPCNIVHLEGKTQKYNKKVDNRTCFVLLWRVLKFNSVITAVLLN